MLKDTSQYSVKYEARSPLCVWISFAFWCHLLQLFIVVKQSFTSDHPSTHIWLFDSFHSYSSSLFVVEFFSLLTFTWTISHTGHQVSRLCFNCNLSIHTRTQLVKPCHRSQLTNTVNWPSLKAIKKGNNSHLLLLRSTVVSHNNQ